jgi:hypothetical protein
MPLSPTSIVWLLELVLAGGCGDVLGHCVRLPSALKP